MVYLPANLWLLELLRRVANPHLPYEYFADWSKVLVEFLNLAMRFQVGSIHLQTSNYD